MGADVLPKGVDHLFSVVEVLDGEEEGHGEGEKADQPEDDLKAEALIELNLYQWTFPLSQFKRGKKKLTQNRFWISALSSMGEESQKVTIPDE